MKFVPSIITLYLPRSDEIVESESIHEALSISETLSIHKFVRQVNDRGDCSTEFFKTVVDQEAWFQCSICEQWFHETCFYV